jgi:hypothetical protein
MMLPDDPPTRETLVDELRLLVDVLASLSERLDEIATLLELDEES